MAGLIAEVAQNYPVQGVHLDYVRYPNRNLGFDDYTVQELKKETGLDLQNLRYPTLPAYGFFEGNPLSQPTTAQTLAYFDNGVPAVLLNSYGQGQVILLNWNATRRDVMASTEILNRSLEFLRSEGQSPVYLLESATNAAEYGGGSFRAVYAWLQDIGEAPEVIEEGDIANLSPDSILVLPNVYLISASTAADLAAYVKQGGNLIMIDGPVRAIENKTVQALTGMGSTGDYFEEETLLVADGEHPLIPYNPAGSTDLADYEAVDEQWREFRQQGINRLVAEVMSGSKPPPQTQVSAAVYPNKEAAKRVLQDWYSWLENGKIDFVVPMAYVNSNPPLLLDMTEWATQVPGGLTHLIPGLASADFDQDNEPRKSIDDIVTEINIVKTGGASGVVLFSLDYMDDEILQGLKQGPFAP